MSNNKPIVFETTAEFEAAVMEVIRKRVGVEVWHNSNRGIDIELLDISGEALEIFARTSVDNLVEDNRNV
jgi:hypothetical protein